MFAASIIALGLASFATAAPVASSSSSAEEFVSTYVPASSTWTSRFANATYTANATVTVAEITVTVTALPTTSTTAISSSSSSASVTSSSSSAVASSSASSSTSEWVAPSSSSSSTSAYVAPTSSAVVYEAAAVKSSSSAAAPTTTYAAPSTSSAAPPATSSQAPPSSGQFQGTATYYYQNGAAGSCGDYHSDNDYIVAVNAPQVAGTCGKHLTITNTKTGTTVNAVAADTCPGCSYGSLDLSSGLFAALGGGDMGQGVFPISWSFN